MREDVAETSKIESLRNAREHLKNVLKSKDQSTIDNAIQHLSEVAGAVYVQRAFPRLREHFEIIVVAVAVAMGFRAYFFQPFKIPTGSMQPTLYGITAQPPAKYPAWESFPLSVPRFLLFGEKRMDIRAFADGKIMRLQNSGDDPRPYYGPIIKGIRKDGRLAVKRLESSFYANLFVIEGYREIIAVPDAFELYVKPGDTVKQGQLLARGTIKAGDHLFVDKIRYNFSHPKRGDIIVFSTEHLTHPGVRTNNFYIKRLVGMPNETVQIDPPYLMADGLRLTNHPSFLRIASRSDLGYHGHVLAPSSKEQPSILSSINSRLTLTSDEYLPMGDNTYHSLDGRYFGPVSREDLLGPAFIVYWPFTSRFGMADKEPK